MAGPAVPSFPTDTPLPACAPSGPGCAGTMLERLVAGRVPVGRGARPSAGSPPVGWRRWGGACWPGPLSAPQSPGQGRAEDSEQLGTVTGSGLFAAA